jgi:hypothetical protein
MLDRNKFKMKGTAEQEWDRMWPEKDHPLKEGDSVQGTYKGVVQNYGSNNSNVWLLEVNGDVVGVWGSTVIDEHMKDIAIDSEVGIEYGGMADSVKRPGKQYKKFLVGVVDDTFGEPDQPVDAPNPL